MIDTVSITLPDKDFQISDHNRFSPCTENLFKPPYIKVTGKSLFKAINNPTNRDKELYNYLPRLTLIKALRSGGFVIFLKIEFSAPKLLFGNNFDELNGSELDPICVRLKDLLLVMGVSVKSPTILKNAEVSTIHYSKNIILTDYSSPYTYLQELRKINLNKSLDLNQTDFRNEGQAVKYHSNDFEVILYDKLSDLKQAKKSDKRTIEKDNDLQLNLFQNIKLKQPFEVLRIEVRIGNRKKLSQVIEKLKFKNTSLIFSNLFSSFISKQILLSVVKHIENRCPKVLKLEFDTLQELASSLQIKNPSLSYSRLLKVIGATALLQELGVREFRNLTNRFGDKQWYRLNKGLNDLVLDGQVDIFTNIKLAIQDFKTIKLEDFKDKI